MTYYVTTIIFYLLVNFAMIESKTTLENWYHPLDPYHITIIIPVWVTVLWYFMFARKMVKLQNLDVSKWRIDVKSVADKIHDFADRLVRKHSSKSAGIF